MSKKYSQLKVKDVMTTGVFTIREDEKIATAQALMDKHHIRHLVVLRQSKLAGLISDRDLSLAAQTGGENLKIEEIMAPEVYAISPETNLAEIVFHMARHKYGSAVAVEGDKVTGIFTVIDALKILGEILAES